jgi:spectinomycin phosphotransferase
MLEKPDLQDVKIIACLQDNYGLQVVQVVFLPLGADQNTAVYRVVTDDGTPYFLKLRRGVFDETSVTVPRFLKDQGISQIIAPLPTLIGQLWANLEPFTVILYPFVEGRNGFEVPLSERQWIEFGRVLKGIHTSVPPAAIMSRLQRETYTPKWREIVRGFQVRVKVESYSDPISSRLGALLKDKRDVIRHLIAQAERLGAVLQARSQAFVLCHSDIHAANLLIDPNNGFYIVDWDNPILAAKERDLMFIGGGVVVPSDPAQEALFYQGYSPAQVDLVALAYYRFERIIQDIAAYCEQIFLSDEGDQDREEGLRQLTSQFLPGDVVDIAYKSEKNLPPDLTPYA